MNPSQTHLQSLGPMPGMLSRLRERLVMKPKTNLDISFLLWSAEYSHVNSCQSHVLNIYSIFKLTHKSIILLIVCYLFYFCFLRQGFSVAKKSILELAL